MDRLALLYADIKATKGLKFAHWITTRSRFILRCVMFSGVAYTILSIFELVPYEVLILWLLPVVPFWYAHEIQGNAIDKLSKKYDFTEDFVKQRIFYTFN